MPAVPLAILSVLVSGGGSPTAGATGTLGPAHAARAASPPIERPRPAMPCKKRRRLRRCINVLPLTGRPSRLQLLLQLVQEAPVRSIADDLVRRGPDHPNLLQQQAVEADGVFGVVLAP